MKKFWRNFLISIFCILVLIFGAMVVRTFTFKQELKQADTKKEIKIKEVKGSVEHLSLAIQNPTISNADIKKTDFLQFEKFLEFLHTTYPNVFRKLDYIPINDYGIILVWRAREKTSLLPLLITGHYDTVGVDNKTLKDWKYEPFSGKIEDGKIWGRGAIDDKASLIAIFEAINSLIDEGFVPKTDIYFAFGFDEETGGNQGAKEIAKYFEKRKIKFEFVLDEGNAVGIDKNEEETALIGISEKGRFAAEIIIKAKGGHASMPPGKTSVTELSKVIGALNKNQMKKELTAQMKEYYRATFNKQNYKMKFLIANMDVLESVLLNELAKNPTDNAFIRTTTALTMLKASDTINVIPDIASVTGDFRLIPSNTAEDVQNHIKNTIEKVTNFEYEIKPLSNEAPSKVSPTKGAAYNKLVKEIEKTFPNAKIIPCMVAGGTDAKHYENLSPAIYRFLPVKVTKEEFGLMHSVNENISVENYTRMIHFYKNLILDFQNQSRGVGILR